jgi:alpha-beta hydrolase superfamily lysophospholipase
MMPASASRRRIFARVIIAGAAVSSLKMKPGSFIYERVLTGAAALWVVLLLAACGGGGHPSARTAGPTPRAHTSASSPGTSRRPAHSRPVPRPPFRVGTVSLQLLEPSSAAIATSRTGAGAPVRLLSTVVRYPATGRPNGRENRDAAPARAAGPFPLIVFSQGYAMPPSAYSWLLDAWTRAGFVVAAPTYPHTDPNAPEGLNESDIVNHPADLRFVIAALRGPHPGGAKPLAGVVDRSRVAIAGQSDGGDVSLAVAADSCCRDGAVSAAVILSGAEFEGFGGAYYAAGSVPLLVVQGTADTINPPGCSVELYDQAPRPKYYLDLLGAQHLQPYVDPGGDRALVARTVVDFLRRYLERRPGAGRALLRDGNATAFARLSSAASAPGSESYCPGAPAP